MEVTKQLWMKTEYYGGFNMIHFFDHDIIKEKISGYYNGSEVFKLHQEWFDLRLDDNKKYKVKLKVEIIEAQDFDPAA